MNDSTILVTGAAGFIGSCLVQFLNEKGYTNLVLCDDFGVEEKRRNWESRQFSTLVERYHLFDWLAETQPALACVFHLGARTDTTEFDYAVHQELNVDFTQQLWQWCTQAQVPLVYASSAATYGAGERGYTDDEEIIPQLQPLNPYGVSKNEIDKWILQQPDAPPFWAGLKFFNVYGPNEGHKGRMASVIWHSFNQIKKTGQVKLFRSHRPDFEDGQQLRDFVYVKDVVKVMYWLFQSATGSQPDPAENDQPAASLSVEAAIADAQSPENNPAATAGGWRQAIAEGLHPEEDPAATGSATRVPPSAIYNLGTGRARSFYDLAAATFRGLDLEPNILFIDMPEDIRDKYQYFTEADMHKLVKAGYTAPFFTLEEGVDDYVRNYLASGRLY